jgi:hypothetical protein
MQQAPVRLNESTPPLYRWIASLLSKEIAEGAWLPGDQVPTEIELAERFAVSQGTMRLAVLEQVNWDGAGVTSLDWQSYPILRFPDVPDVRINLINRPDVPATGGGEATTYPMAAAIGNAIFDATGARLREGPFTPERMKAALAASRA